VLSEGIPETEFRGRLPFFAFFRFFRQSPPFLSLSGALSAWAKAHPTSMPTFIAQAWSATTSIMARLPLTPYSDVCMIQNELLRYGHN